MYILDNVGMVDCPRMCHRTITHSGHERSGNILIQGQLNLIPQLQRQVVAHHAHHDVQTELKRSSSGINKLASSLNLHLFLTLPSLYTSEK